MKLIQLSHILAIVFLVQSSGFSQTAINNIDSRERQSLNGDWKIIVDPYDNGFYSFHLSERKDGFFVDRQMKDPSELIEYNFDKSETLKVPGDWNSQLEKLYYYEGTVWYRKKFKVKQKEGKKYYINFGAVNYVSHVYLNGKKLGSHEGGFTPFAFEVTDELLAENSLVVRVENIRKADRVPTVNTDWWNYGGITRDVDLIEVPEIFIQDYFIQLAKGNPVSSFRSNKSKKISGWIELNQAVSSRQVVLEIPELGLKKEYLTDSEGKINFEFNQKLELWSPENPKLYEVIIKSGTDIVTDRIGFRSIETKGDEILLNGNPIVLKGICIHEEDPFNSGRAYSSEQSRTLLNWAKQMNCNYVRLAHYPHNRHMTKMADELGILVWSEIPVYWTIQFEKEEVYKKAELQLSEMIERDKNRASIIIWSMANETPLGDARTKFLSNLAAKAKELDPTRLTSAALLVWGDKENKYLKNIDDPLGEYLDVLAINEYIGWYEGKPELCDSVIWKSKYTKPLLISEFGGGALYNHHGQTNERWTEEYQTEIYKYQVKMFARMPMLKGISPWILKDFRSPRRVLPEIQDDFNRKGLISESGQKKDSYYIMQEFYGSTPNNSFSKE